MAINSINDIPEQEQSQFQKDYIAWKNAQSRGYGGGFGSYLMDKDKPTPPPAQPMQSGYATPYGRTPAPAQPIARGDVPSSAGRIMGGSRPQKQTPASAPQAAPQNDVDTSAMYNADYSNSDNNSYYDNGGNDNNDNIEYSAPSKQPNDNNPAPKDSGYYFNVNADFNMPSHEGSDLEDRMRAANEGQPVGGNNYYNSKYDNYGVPVADYSYQQGYGMPAYEPKYNEPALEDADRNAYYYNDAQAQEDDGDQGEPTIQSPEHFSGLRNAIYMPNYDKVPFFRWPI